MSENSGQGSGIPGQQAASGLSSNVAGALSYVLGIITGVLFYVLEKDDRFVRFHAMQSILLSVAWIALFVVINIVEVVLGLIPFLGFIVIILGILVSVVLGLGGLVLWIYLIVKAFQGEKVSLPYIGEMAEKYASGER